MYLCIPYLGRNRDNPTSYFIDRIYLQGSLLIIDRISPEVLLLLSEHHIVHFKNDQENLITETAKLFIPLNRFILQCSVSTSFLSIFTTRFLFFSIPVSLDFLNICLLPLFPSTCNFPSFQAFLCFPDLAVQFLSLFLFYHYSLIIIIYITLPTSILYMTLNNVMVRFHRYCSFEECGVPFHCRRFLVSSGPEWYHMTGSYLWVK